MKTTVELDEQKLRRLMELTGIKTRREAIDFALTEAERVAALKKQLQKRWSPEDLKEALEPHYDVLKLREEERPQ